MAAKSVGRLRDKLRDLFRGGRGRSVGRTVETLAPLLRGWMQYFRLAQTRGVFEELDGWLRRRLRCILWRQWKRPRTRAQRLMQRGLDEARAWASANNGRGPWWNAGASHMNDAFRKTFFERLGLISLLEQHPAYTTLHEPPYTEPYVRWCGEGETARLPPTRSLFSAGELYSN